jgi:tetratricopeptide (TPR) repeat protein
MNEWEILIPELIDEDFDFDYSYSYASRIAEAYDRLGLWNKVISSVEQSLELSGEKSIREMKLLADAYDNLGNYEKCIQAYDEMAAYWYEVNDTDKELNIICYKVSVAEKNFKYGDAIEFYKGFSDFYYRFERKPGLIEFNIACLYIIFLNKQFIQTYIFLIHNMI